MVGMKTGTITLMQNQAREVNYTNLTQESKSPMAPKLAGIFSTQETRETKVP